MTRDEIIQQIIDLMNELKTPDSGSLFVFGDMSDMSSCVALKSNPEAVAEMLCIKMDTNEEFKNIMISIFSSWLSNHPDERERIMGVIALNDMEINMN